MKRGTTPTLRFELPFAAADIDGGYITISQRGRANMDIDIARCKRDGDALEVDLTQEETLALRSEAARIQLRIKIGERVMASDIITADVGEILKEGVI